jgi:hypothetical protein
VCKLYLELCICIKRQNIKLSKKQHTEVDFYLTMKYGYALRKRKLSTSVPAKINSLIMLQQFLIYLAVIAYFGIACCFFYKWLDFFIQDEEMNSAERSFSTVILIVGSMLWVIIVPFAYLELLSFHKKHKGIIDFLIDMSNKNVSEE